MKFQRIFISVLIVLFAIPLSAQFQVFRERDSEPCSIATLNGTYGSFAEGTNLVQFPGTPAPPYPVVAVGLHTFDGSGNWSLTYATSLGGSIVPWGATAKGTYYVTPECELSVIGHAANGMPTMFVGTITGDGIFREAQILYTDAARVQSATLRKTPPWGCTQDTIEGNYAVFGHGFVTLPNLPPLTPVAHAGSFAANGESFSGTETFKLANTAGQDTFTAKYLVKPDCTITAEITTPTEVLHEVGTITGVGEFQEVHLIVTDSGWVFADTGKKK